MRTVDLTEAVHEAMPTECSDRRFVIAQTQEYLDQGWNVSSVRMNIHSEVFVNLWRPLQEDETHFPKVVRKDTGEPIKVEHLAFFRSDR